MKAAIYPGSFDPITLGHLDVIRRAARCFDKVYVCTMINGEKKNPMFTPEKRVELIKASVKDIENVEVEAFTGLLADYAMSKNCTVLVKGLRNATDFDQEYHMAAINRGIWHELETIFIPASAEFQHFSSTMAREMFRYGQNMSKYVPAPVAEELNKLNQDK